MYKDDDEQEDSSTIAATRYPCMPSLVALQQMRNRLHLAYVGKKLMKWTAQATGQELRKLAWELSQTCLHFRDEMRDGYILLARARYFYPNLNKMVLEHIGHEANTTVNIKAKSISGVKVLHFDILDTGQDTYQHLGIEKGGQAILEAKQAWRDLLRRVIHILEERTCFEQVDLAHRSATKKMNVLAKIVIPRTLLSIQYIIETLEEMAREDFYRLKKILKNKRNKQKCNHEKFVRTCPACLRMKAKQEEVKENCIICGAPLDVEYVPEETAKIEDKIKGKETKLEELKAQIGELVEITKEIEESCIVSESIKDFLKTAEQLKEKLDEKSEVKALEPIPSDTSLEKLCFACKKRFEDEQAVKNLPLKESIETIKSEKQLPEENICELHAKMDTDLELGTFETEIQEIIKVIRVKNEDGSVSEEKKVIKIRREIRDPVKLQPGALSAPNNTNERVDKIMYQSSELSNKSTPFSDSKTVGITYIMVKDSKVIRAQRAKSDVLVSSPPMADLKVRSCISSMSCITLDSSNITFNILSSAETFSVDKIRELKTSSTNFEEILKLFKLHTQNSKMISTENIELGENSRLTESERNLIARITDDIRKSKLRSKSNNNIKQNIKNKLKKTTSFNDNNNTDENQYNNN